MDTARRASADGAGRSPRPAGNPTRTVPHRSRRPRLGVAIGRHTDLPEGFGERAKHLRSRERDPNAALHGRMLESRLDEIASLEKRGRDSRGTHAGWQFNELKVRW